MILKVTLTHASNTFPIHPDKECLAQLNIWYLSTMHVMQQTFHQAHQQTSHPVSRSNCQLMLKIAL